MALTPRQRHLILGSVLVVTLVLVFWPGNEPEDNAGQAESETVSRPAEGRAAPAAGPQPQTGAARPAPPANLVAGRPGRSAEKPPIKDLFAQQSWQPPPPPPTEAHAAPEVPPLPFTYLGRMIEDGRVTVYLSQEDRNIAVRQGDVINGVYRLKRVSPAALTFVYIPMNKQQTLEIGRSNE